jgi:hypothetical protein
VSLFLIVGVLYCGAQSIILYNHRYFSSALLLCTKIKCSEKGGHLCGAVRFAAAGEPLWIAHCHCTSCRRNTGAALATFVGVRRAQFRYLQGKPAVYESSPQVWRSFCPACGTPLVYEAARWADEVHINIGTLDEPARFAPTMHVHVAEQLPWLKLADRLPRYARSSHNAEPLPADSREDV